MSETLMKKLQQVIEQHYKETGERLESIDVNWFRSLGSKSDVESISVTIKKGL